MEVVCCLFVCCLWGGRRGEDAKFVLVAAVFWKSLSISISISATTSLSTSHHPLPLNRSTLTPSHISRSTTSSNRTSPHLESTHPRNTNSKDQMVYYKKWEDFTRSAISLVEQSPVKVSVCFYFRDWIQPVIDGWM